MCDARVIVLKFGGSVLTSEAALPGAVEEIQRWRQQGWRVVAIVSALNGRTDELFRCCRTIAADAPGCAVAAHVANGELQSASLLGLHLARARVPAVVLHPAAIALRGRGEPLDAEAVSLDQAVIHGALERTGVVVLPGFLAVDEDGRTVLLGRGGSDLSALFVARQIGAARCRLIKDVDGLYDRDPKTQGARRYSSATWEEALATDGSILQHKAVRYARSVSYPFELGCLGRTEATHIGAAETEFAAAVSIEQNITGDALMQSELVPVPAA